MVGIRLETYGNGDGYFQNSMTFEVLHLQRTVMLCYRSIGKVGFIKLCVEVKDHKPFSVK